MSEILKDIPEKELSAFDVEANRGESGLSLIGFPESGKSVFASVFIYYLQQASKIAGLTYSIEGGYDVVASQLDYLIRQKKFPPKTPLGIDNVVKIAISKERKLFGRKTIRLQLSDHEGDLFERIIKNKNSDPRALLINDRAGSTGLGPAASVVTARAYAVAVDCGEYEQWATADFRYNALLKVLTTLKGKKSFSTPIAILFTRTDLLPETLLEDQKTGDALLEKIPNFNVYLHNYFDESKIRVLPVNIGVERDQNGHPQSHKDGGGHIVKEPLISKGDMGMLLDWMFRWL